MQKLKILAIGLFFSLLISCQSEEPNLKPQLEDISPEILSILEANGFNPNGVVKYDGRYIVERDIVFTEDQIRNLSSGNGIPSVEHYRTNNIVSGTPRTISVYVSTSFPSKYMTATDNAISRYNAENLNLNFQRVTSSSSADITIVPSPWYYGWFGILGSAGFPTAGGDPYNQIMLTRSYYDNVTDLGALTTTIAHEMGHCIGYRHTDYMDRSYSCGGATDNEGAADVGANHIAGTPTGPDANSWMLACSDGSDRPFTANDKAALDGVY